jgi:tripartite-type tricarboxylate transporter receptor subunit TctC
MLIVKQRWGLRVVLALVPAAALCGDACAQSAYPSRPVRMIVTTAAGGGGDVVARLVAQGLAERLGSQVVVENRPGAGGILGYEQVAKSPADGHTLLFCAPTLAINPATYRKLPYDGLRDFAPVTQAVFAPHLLIVHPSVPARNVRELIGFARARPDQVLYASGGHGTAPHLAMELFNLLAQTRMTHVPYKGASPGLVDLMAGQVAVMAPAMIAVMPQVRSGKLRALGVTSAARIAIAPEIPTVAESGLPDYETVVWYGLLAPAATPPDIIGRLYRETAAILRTPDSRERIAGGGAEVLASSPAEFAALIRAETLKWAKVAKAAGITPE